MVKAGKRGNGGKEGRELSERKVRKEARHGTVKGEVGESELKGYGK